MVREYSQNSILKRGEFIISVRRIIQEYPYKLIVNHSDTIFSLKDFFYNKLNINYNHQEFVISPSIPYSLKDTMYLENLLEEHRTLFLIISDVHDISEIPKRYYLKDNDGSVLDLMNIMKDDIEEIGRWFHIDRNIKVIYVSATHLDINEILYSMAEHILKLNDLQKIYIKNMEGKDKSRVSFEAIHYLSQEISLDKYRYSMEPVKIMLDPYILNNLDDDILNINNIFQL